MAGLKGLEFSAKDFRPTGATVAVKSHINPDMIHRVGRWASQEVFESQFVHSRPEKYFKGKIFEIAL